jgi:hypothetical protein
MYRRNLVYRGSKNEKEGTYLQGMQEPRIGLTRAANWQPPGLKTRQKWVLEEVASVPSCEKKDIHETVHGLNAAANREAIAGWK